MTDDKDPQVQALFDAAPRAGSNAEFVARVMADINRQRRRTIMAWVAVAVLLVPVIGWISGPLAASFEVATQLLPDTLVTVEADWLAQVLAPVNSAAGLAGLLFLGGWLFWRKVFS